MRVTILQADHGGSGFYRVSEVARAVNERPELDVQVTVTNEVDVEARQNQQTRLIDVYDFQCDFDLLVVQRPLAQGVNALVKLAVEREVPVVVDLDDDFHSVHPGNIAALDIDPARRPDHNKYWLWDTCLRADAMTVSTPMLRKYGRPGKAQVVRNYLPERIFDVKKTTTDHAVGWTGTVATHPADLQATKGALRGLGVPFVAIGDPTGVAAALNIQKGSQTFYALPWSDSVESYWQNIIEHITIGIAPLEVSKFNKAKSWLKGLEYASLGLPFVASPLPEYVELARRGAGVVATTGNRWRSEIDRLLQDPVYYSETADAVQETARELTLEKHVEEWVSVWKTAADRA